MRKTLSCFVVLGFVAPTAFAGSPCTVFNDQSQFEAFNQAEGNTLQGLETFDESNIPVGGKQFLPAPLDQDPNTYFGVGFPNGLAFPNLAIWDNVTDGPNPPDLNPSGSIDALYVIGRGFFFAASNKVGSDLFLDQIRASIDLVFPDPSNSGVGFELSWFFFQAGWHVSVYNAAGDTIGLYVFQGPPGPEPQTSFFGVWCAQGIGRINIYDDASFPQPTAIANIEMWL